MIKIFSDFYKCLLQINDDAAVYVADVITVICISSYTATE